jgi:hypothetical protein
MDMKKTEIIEELHRAGEVWADMTYSKAYLEKSLNDLKQAQSMTLDELEAELRARGLLK